ncbi:MAG: hypothetical protein QOG48_993 [Verrucomicrobiota bacterium]
MANDLLNKEAEVKPDPKPNARQTAEMRKFSADIDRAIENNGAVTLPTDAQKYARAKAWVVGAAIIGSALLLRRSR